MQNFVAFSEYMNFKVLPWFSESHFPFLKLWNKKSQNLQTSNNNKKKQIKKHEEKNENIYISKHLFFKYSSALRTISEEFVECLTKENVMSKVVTE